MPTKFLESVSGKLGEQWVATLLTPAFVFWAGGLAAYGERHGIQTITQWFSQYSDPLQLAILASALGIVVASSFIAQRFDTAILRGLEGYWYPGLRWLLIPFTHWQRKRRLHLIKTLTSLNPKLSNDSASAPERAEFTRCDRALRQFPTKEYDILPTRLGNILRTAERHPYERYGLDALKCWPHLWLLLPASVKQELQTAQASLSNAARLFLWSLLLLIWSIWSWWVIPLAIVAALFSYAWSLAAAAVYADLLSATFDLHRQLLYQALRWTIPGDPDEERRVGKQLSQYLWRGTI